MKYKFLCTLLIIILNSFPGLSIENRIDSLKNKILLSGSDTSRISLMMKIALEYEELNSDTATLYYEKAIQITTMQLEGSNKNPAKYKKLLMQILSQKGNFLIELHKYNDASDCFFKSNELILEIFENPNQVKQYAYNLLGIGIINLKKGKLDDANLMISQLIENFTNLHDTTGLISTYRHLGLISYYKGNYLNSVEHFFNALQLAEQQNDKPTLSLILNNLGGANQKLGNYKTALEYYQKTLKIRTEINDIKGVASVSNNIGVVYRNQGKHAEAIKVFKYSLEIKEQLNDKMGIAISNVNIGNVYEELKDYEKSIEYFKNSLYYFNIVGDKKKEIVVTGNIAKLYNDIGKHEKAIEYATKALELAREKKLLPQEKFAYEHLSEAYAGIDNYEKALQYFRYFTNVKDSLFSIERDKTIAELETKYQTAKKEQEIELLSTEKEIHKLKIRQKSLQVIILIVAIILLAITSVLFIIRRNLIAKQQLKDLQIKEGKQRTKDMIDAQEKERERIARDLHDGIGQLLAAASLNFSKFSEDTFTNNPEKNKSFNKSIKILNNACADIRTISHQMMPKVLTNIGLIPAIEDMLAFSFEKTEIKYYFETFGIEERFGAEMEVGFFRITQELINNIIKHANASEVSIQLYKSQNTIILMIEDDGKGINSETSSNGIGLRNITSRTEMLNGNFSIEKSPVKGTIATASIPLKIE